MPAAVDKATEPSGVQTAAKPWKQVRGVRLAQPLPPGGRLPGLAGAQRGRSTHSLTWGPGLGGQLGRLDVTPARFPQGLAGVKPWA